MTNQHVPEELRDLYEIREWKHACAILKQDFPSEWAEITSVLASFRLHKTHITAGGGGKSSVAKALDTAFYAFGWREKKFDTKVVIDQTELDSPTHSIDCYKNRVALEVEWNNKDPFFDRDLNNFRLLFDLRAVSVGVIVTRADELQEIFRNLGSWKKYGQSTTHWSRLIRRIEGGSGGGCPILAFGITKKLYREDL